MSSPPLSTRRGPSVPRSRGSCASRRAPRRAGRPSSCTPRSRHSDPRRERASARRARVAGVGRGRRADAASRLRSQHRRPDRDGRPGLPVADGRHRLRLRAAISLSATALRGAGTGTTDVPTRRPQGSPPPQNDARAGAVQAPITGDLCGHLLQGVVRLPNTAAQTSGSRIRLAVPLIASRRVVEPRVISGRYTNAVLYAWSAPIPR